VNPHRVGRCGHRPGREAEQRHNGSIDVLKLLGLRDPLPRFVVDLLERGCNLYASFQACSARAMRSARPLAGQCLRMNAAAFGLVFATGFIDEAEAFVTPFARFLLGERGMFWA
jgi:hypothetical protein